MSWLLALLTFSAVFFGIFALNLLITDVFKFEQAQEQVRKRSKRQEGRRQEVRQDVREQQAAAGGITELATQLKREKDATLLERFDAFVAQSGLKTTPLRVLGATVLATLIGGVLSYALFRLSIATVLTTILISTIPLLRVAIVRKKRLNRLREQLPDALELIGRVLRAGQTIVQAMNSIGEEFQDPIGAEFSICYEQQNLGLPMDVAMRDMSKRTGLVEVKIFVLALLVHRQSGGNLTELLERLSTLIRKRLALRGEIKGLTAEGRMQALVLILLPIGVWLALSLLNPDYANDLFKHPWLIAVTLGLTAIGAAWINRIVNFDF